MKELDDSGLDNYSSFTFTAGDPIVTVPEGTLVVRNVNYKTSNETNNFFQGYKVRLYKQIKDKTFKQVLSVFEVQSDLWTKFKTMFINDLIKLETKYYFIDDSIVRGN